MGFRTGRSFGRLIKKCDVWLVSAEGEGVLSVFSNEVRQVLP